MSNLLHPPYPTDPSDEQEDLPLHWQYLHDLSGDNPEFELELLSIFVEDTQLHLDALKHAIVTQDFVTIAQETHHVKGASANIGAVPMQAAALKLEQQAKLDQLEGADQLCQELQNFLDRIRAYVQR